MRVDLDNLAAKAQAAQESADYRGDNGPGARWIVAPRRDGTVDVVVEHDGADVFDRVLLVDAEFAVAAQPAVVRALVAHIGALKQMLGENTDALQMLADFYETGIPLHRGRVSRARDLIEQGVVLP